MLRLIALTTLCISPPAYLLMKGMAQARHKAFKNTLEKDPTPLKDTWHQRVIDWVYPL